VIDPSAYLGANFKSNLYHWFNPAAYSAPAGNAYGNTSRNSLRGPFFMRGDMTFMKNLPITERHNLMYRLEIFNVLSPWHGTTLTPSSTMSSTNFGSLLNIETLNSQPLAESMQSGTKQLWNSYVRKLQMTLKYTF